MRGRSARVREVDGYGIAVERVLMLLLARQDALLVLGLGLRRVRGLPGSVGTVAVDRRALGGGHGRGGIGLRAGRLFALKLLLAASGKLLLAHTVLLIAAGLKSLLLLKARHLLRVGNGGPSRQGALGGVLLVPADQAGQVGETDERDDADQDIDDRAAFS